MLNTLLPDHHLPAISVSGIAYDSRKVKSGDLFLATRGVLRQLFYANHLISPSAIMILRSGTCLSIRA